MSLKEALARLKAETEVLQNRKNVVTRLNELVRKLDAAMRSVNVGGVDPTPTLKFDGVTCKWDLVERGPGETLSLTHGVVNPYLRIHVTGVRFDFGCYRHNLNTTPNETAAELLIEVLEKNLEKVVDTEAESG